MTSSVGAAGVSVDHLVQLEQGHTARLAHLVSRPHASEAMGDTAMDAPSPHQHEETP